MLSTQGGQRKGRGGSEREEHCHPQGDECSVEKAVSGLHLEEWVEPGHGHLEGHARKRGEHEPRHSGNHGGSVKAGGYP